MSTGATAVQASLPLVLSRSAPLSRLFASCTAFKSALRGPASLNGIHTVPGGTCDIRAVADQRSVSMLQHIHFAYRSAYARRATIVAHARQPTSNAQPLGGTVTSRGAWRGGPRELGSRQRSTAPARGRRRLSSGHCGGPTVADAGSQSDYHALNLSPGWNTEKHLF